MRLEMLAMMIGVHVRTLHVAADGRPAVHGAATHPAAPGMRFIGYTNPISGMFREIAIDARRIARAIKTELGTAAQHREPVQGVAA